MFKPLKVLGAALFLTLAIAVNADQEIDYAKASPQQVADAVTFDKTKFDVETFIEGPEWKASFAAAGQPPESYYDLGKLGAHKNFAGKLINVILEIIIVYRAKELSNFDAATLEGGRSPQTKSLGRRQLGSSCGADGTCSFAEGIGVLITNEYLAAKADSGFDIRVSAKDGNRHVLSVPSNYVKGFLLALARPLGADGLPAGAAAAPAK